MIPKGKCLMKIVVLILAILYFLSPYDFLPDFLGPVGRVDDVLVAIFSYWLYRFKLSKSRVESGTGPSGAQHDFDHSSGHYSREQPSDNSIGGQNAHDPFETLELTPHATTEEIESQYKKLMAQYHPDKVHHLGPELRDLAHKKSVQIGKAYQDLKKNYN